MQPFYTQVALISKDPELAHNYNRVLNASNKYLLVKHFEEVSSLKLKSDLLENINTFIFDLQTVSLDDLVKFKTLLRTKKILAIDSEPANIIDALAIGIDGYLSNRNDYKGLLDFTWKVSRGEKTLDQDSMTYLFNNFKKDLGADLTSQERQVLEELQLSRSYDQIANKLAISRATVKTHIEQIYDKLDANDKFEAIEKAKTQKLI